MKTLHIPVSKGVIQVGLFDTLSRINTIIDGGPNMVTYAGIDLLGKLLAGQDYTINTMYMEFTNEASAPVVTPDPADGRNYYAALEAPGNTSDYIRVALIADPTLEATDANFTTNRVNFFAMSTGSTAGRGGHVFSNAAPSKIYGVALVAAPDADDASQDIVFSRSYNFTAKDKQVNEEISIGWSHIFGEDIASSSL